MHLFLRIHKLQPGGNLKQTGSILCRLPQRSFMILSSWQFDDSHSSLTGTGVSFMYPLPRQNGHAPFESGLTLEDCLRLAVRLSVEDLRKIPLTTVRCVKGESLCSLRAGKLRTFIIPFSHVCWLDKVWRSLKLAEYHDDS